VGFVATSALCLSSFGLPGCVQTPKDLFGDRSQPLARHLASRAGSRSESESKSSLNAWNLLPSHDAAESDDPFLKDDRRSLNRQPVENAARQSIENKANRRAELIAGASPQLPKSKTQADTSRSARDAEPTVSGQVEKSVKRQLPVPGKVMQVTRSPRGRKNFTTALDEALVDAGNSRSDEVELLAPPPEKVALDSATKPGSVTSNPSPVRLVRPIPDEEPSVSANKSAEVPAAATEHSTAPTAVAETIPATVPEVVSAVTPERMESRSEAPKPNPPSQSAEPFVVRIRPAVPEPATVSVPAPQIARVNASQGARDVMPLTQSVHTDESHASTPSSINMGEKRSPDVAASASTVSTPQAGPLLIPPSQPTGSPAITAANDSPASRARNAMVPTISNPISVQLDQRIETDDDPPSLAAVTGNLHTPMNSLATGPALIASPSVSSPAPLLPSPATAIPTAESSSSDATTSPPQKPAPIWFWLGGLCGACGLLGLIVFTRMHHQNYARATAPKRDHALIYKLRLRRSQSAAAAKVTERAAA
jgi:hypothetical protein